MMSMMMKMISLFHLLQMTMIMVLVVMVKMMKMMISLFQLLPESVTNMERGRYYRNRSKSFSTSQLLRLRSPTNHMCTVHCALCRFHEITEKWIRAHRQDYRGNRTGDLQVDIIIIITKPAMTFFSSSAKYAQAIQTNLG